MEPRIVVNTSEYAFGYNPQILTTTGIGSCVAVCLYEPRRRLGALLHIMLPRAEGDGLNPMRFADTALSMVVVEMQRRDVFPEYLAAKLVGGAQMFKTFAGAGSIGERNVAEVVHTLGALGIRIESQDVGGNTGRSLEFDLATGLVNVYSHVTPSNS